MLIIKSIKQVDFDTIPQTALISWWWEVAGIFVPSLNHLL